MKVNLGRSWVGGAMGNRSGTRVGSKPQKFVLRSAGVRSLSPPLSRACVPGYITCALSFAPLTGSQVRLPLPLYGHVHQHLEFLLTHPQDP